MKRKIAISLAALMGASLLASPTLAQVSLDAGANVGAGANAGAGGTGAGADVGADIELRTEGQSVTDLDPGTTAAIGASFDGVLSAINNNSATATSISSMTEVSSVNVIRIQEMQDADMDALTSAETENSASIDELQASIEGNSEVMAELEAQNIDPDTVVAADVTADGSLTVYVR